MQNIAERRTVNFGTRKWMPEEGGGNLDIETRCMQEGETGEHVEIEARCLQKIGERERGKLDIETRMNARSCWDEKRKSRYWTQMTVHARSCGETRGSWDIETAWMREAVERHRWGGLWEATVEPDIKPNECRKLLRGTGNIEARWMQEVVVGHRGGSLDIKTKWTQEVMGRLRGKYRYWNPMNAGSLGSLMRGTGGKLDIETRWVQEVVERQGEKLRHWNQVEMHAKSC